ncbi:hypothetical protein SAMN02745944_03638 [Clostridium magnum DSM 2767]|nr:hypothetical protein SAMN02745944_03638 [Clostridium magnum DSM 2767]
MIKQSCQHGFRLTMRNVNVGIGIIATFTGISFRLTIRSAKT